jgi:hypothetical protein
MSEVRLDLTVRAIGSPSTRRKLRNWSRQGELFIAFVVSQNWSFKPRGLNKRALLGSILEPADHFLKMKLALALASAKLR